MKIPSITFFLILLSFALFGGCTSGNKYEIACQQLQIKCTDERSFNAALNIQLMHTAKEFESRDQELTRKFEDLLKPFQKKSFLIDVLYFQDPNLFKLREFEKISGLPIFKQQSHFKKKKTLVEISIDNLNEFTLRESSQRFKEYSKICEQLRIICTFTFTGKLDAVYSKEIESGRWQGWVDVIDFAAEPINASHIKSSVISRTRLAIVQAINSEKKESFGFESGTIKSLFDEQYKLLEESLDLESKQ